jgi:hypothetical protein
VPLVCWGANSRFGGSGDPARSAWDRFFEPVSPVRLTELLGRGHSYFPPKWNDTNLTAPENNTMSGPYSRIAALPFLTRTEAVTVSDFHAPLAALLALLPAGHPLGAGPLEEAYMGLLKKYVKPRREIVEKVEALEATLARPVLAVHVRGSDKSVEVKDLDAFHRAYQAAIDRAGGAMGGSPSMLLLTDWAPVVAAYRARYGERVTVTTAGKTEGKIGMHFQRERMGAALGEEVLVDVLLGARCDGMVGMGWSNVSLFMEYFGRLRGWESSRVELIGPRMHRAMNTQLLGKP